MNSLYKNISLRELPALLRSAYDGDMEQTAERLETIDMMLGVLRMRSLINSRERSAKTRWTRGRNLTAIFENIILRKRTKQF